jgi:hypothetical protein
VVTGAECELPPTCECGHDWVWLEAAAEVLAAPTTIDGFAGALVVLAQVKRAVWQSRVESECARRTRSSSIGLQGPVEPSSNL